MKEIDELRETMTLGVIFDAEGTDAALTDLERHDAKYHPDGYEEGDTCKYREDRAKGDIVDLALDPENVDGEEVQRKTAKKENVSSAEGGVNSATASKEDRVKEIFKEYCRNKLRSDKWLCKNLGIQSGKDSARAESAIYAYMNNKKTKEDVIRKLMELSKGIPDDAWKPGKKSGASGGSKWTQAGLPLFSLSSFGSHSGSSGGGWSSVGGSLSKYYHAQGEKKYSTEKHEATGLYKTKRPGGKALAREEDIPGMSPFNKRRPFFNETGTVPQTLTDQELEHFRYTANGSTYPTVGNVGGRNYIVKRGVLPEGVRRNADLNDHLRTEVAADKFIRAAGLRAPVCTMFERQLPVKKSKVDEKKLEELFDKVVMYKIAKEQYEQAKKDKKASKQDVEDARAVKHMMRDDFDKAKDALGKDYEEYKKELQDRAKDGQLMPKKQGPTTENVKIAEYVEGGVSLPRVWFNATKAQKDEIRRQVVEAYPVMAFLENVDAFKNDNVLVDRDNRIWFVDNGACFDYRAQGGKKLLDGDDRMASSKSKNAKPWFYERTDPTDMVTGYLGLAYAPDQKLLQEILSEASDQELVDAAKKYNFSELVKTLPQDLQKPGLVSYAKKLDETIRNPPKGWIKQ